MMTNDLLLGVIPNEICDLKGLRELNLEGNEGLSCYPSCLKADGLRLHVNGSVVSKVLCVDMVNAALCGLIAATDVSRSYGEWSCDSDGRTRTDPCKGSNRWNNIGCLNGHVVSISMYSRSGNEKLLLIVVVICFCICRLFTKCIRRIEYLIKPRYGVQQFQWK